MSDPEIRLRRTWLARVATLAAAIAVPLVLITPAAGHTRPASAPAPNARVITDWNAIAARTIFAENATPIPSSALYFGFVSAAVHDAVVAIEGGYEPYNGPRSAPRGASSEAAAATAAYRVLAHYFPASAANLERDYAASLDQVTAGPARHQGVWVGTAAAAAMIWSRRDDGRNAAITRTPGTQPGQWRPTPDAFAPMAVPWLGFVRPLALRSPTQIELPGPDALTSARYTRDFIEVRDYGAINSTVRTAAQTDTARFFADNAVAQYQAGLRGQVTRRGLDIAASARAFALLGVATADSLIACWRSKYDENYWRPITAIREADTDGNPATAPDPGWTPLLATPPYPDYPSGHACFTGAATGVLSHLFGARSLDLELASAVTGTTRQYDSAAALDLDAINARIWLGLHFRTAMTDANRLGHAVARWTLRHEFEPTRPGWSRR